MAPKSYLCGLLFVALIPINLSAQDSACTRRTVAVGVVDQQWNLVPNLSGASFRGRLAGEAVQVLSASVDASPRKLVLVLGASGSMLDRGGGWEYAKSISADLVRYAPQRTSIAILYFPEAVIDTPSFDQNRTAVLKRLGEVINECEQPRRIWKTALYDTLASARGNSLTLTFGDIIFTVTDGWDTRSQTRPERLERDLLTSGIRLYAVTVASTLPNRRRAYEATDIKRLLSIVEATGGNALGVPYDLTEDPYVHIKAKTSQEAVTLAFHRLYEQIGAFYRLDLKLPTTLTKPTRWKLEVVDASGKPMKNVEIRYPQELMPCTNANP